MKYIFYLMLQSSSYEYLQVRKNSALWGDPLSHDSDYNSDINRAIIQNSDYKWLSLSKVNILCTRLEIIKYTKILLLYKQMVKHHTSPILHT